MPLRKSIDAGPVHSSSTSYQVPGHLGWYHRLRSLRIDELPSSRCGNHLELARLHKRTREGGLPGVRERNSPFLNASSAGKQVVDQQEERNDERRWIRLPPNPTMKPSNQRMTTTTRTAQMSDAIPSPIIRVVDPGTPAAPMPHPNRRSSFMQIRSRVVKALDPLFANLVPR